MTEHPSGGGSYLRQPDGSLHQVEAPTQPHEAGDAPRTADGLLIGTDGLAIPPADPGAAAPLPDEQEA